MFQQGIKGVDFVICNTDAQALQNSGVPNKIQLGVNLTEGLGAGANPDVGEQAAVESLEDIHRMLDTNTKMVFITAGMGGGTGTGAAPIIAKMAKELDILTVGIVTMPFQFEGKTRNEQAQKGIETLRAHVDSLIVINNNKLREVYGNLGFKAGFSKADEVLATASRGIAEVITHHYTQNIDLRDAKTVLSNSGTAIMGSATASGKTRAHEAIMKALDSPLLNDNKITGAKNVLLLIVSGSQEITIDEIGEINDHIQNEAGHGANIIMGVGEDESLQESISVTIIATGFDVEQQDEISNTEVKKVIHALEDDQNNDVHVKEREPAIITPDIILEKEEEKETIVKHTLFEDEIVIDTKMDLIPTTEFIKNLNVVYDEVLDTIEEDDFVITPNRFIVIKHWFRIFQSKLHQTFFQNSAFCFGQFVFLTQQGLPTYETSGFVKLDRKTKSGFQWRVFVHNIVSPVPKCFFHTQGVEGMHSRQFQTMFGSSCKDFIVDVLSKFGWCINFPAQFTNVSHT